MPNPPIPGVDIQQFIGLLVNEVVQKIANGIPNPAQPVQIQTRNAMGLPVGKITNLLQEMHEHTQATLMLVQELRERKPVDIELVEALDNLSAVTEDALKLAKKRRN